MKLLSKLKKEYQLLFESLQILSSKVGEVNWIVDKIIKNKDRYTVVAENLNIPWYVISIIHCMESSLDFTKHLHNGDPLTGHTMSVPEGRPAVGDPPFTWEESAKDALKFQKLNTWQDWSITGILFKLEEYNGWGYRKKHPEVLSPYLWSFSNHYTSGKYVADGRWSNTAVSNQAGAAVILRRLAEREIIDLTYEINTTQILFTYSKKYSEEAVKLQAFLNSFDGIYLLQDGKLGLKSSAAFKKLTGYYLAGDPRIKKQKS